MSEFVSDDCEFETAGWAAENFVRGVGVGMEEFGEYELRSTHCDSYGAVTGFVYFMAIGDPYITHVKVGFTRKNPYSRMRDLQTGCPFKIRMLGFVFGNLEFEAELHDVFREERAEGEWFAFGEYVEKNIRRILDADY
jgi:hypothetical protein